MRKSRISERDNIKLRMVDDLKPRMKYRIAAFLRSFLS